MRKQRIFLALALLLPLAGCFSDSELRWAPAGGGSSGGGSSGGNGFINWWQGKTPTQPVQIPAGATGLAKAEASPSPEPSPEASTVPQAVPPSALESIAGVQEVHYASTPLQCRQMANKFIEQGIRLELIDIRPMNQPGRRGNPRARSRRVPGRRDRSGTYGRMYICLFKGPDALRDRYGVNDDYINSGLEIPDHNNVRHPNDYRPNPNASPDPPNVNRRTVQDPDPSRPAPPDPYKDLPY